MKDYYKNLKWMALDTTGEPLLIKAQIGEDHVWAEPIFEKRRDALALKKMWGTNGKIVKIRVIKSL